MMMVMMMMKMIMMMMMMMIIMVIMIMIMMMMMKVLHGEDCVENKGKNFLTKTKIRKSQSKTLSKIC